MVQISVPLLLALVLPAVAGRGVGPGGSFTYTNSTFLLNNEPYQVVGGQMDPQRIPHEYWRQRLSMARAMGLNTIFSYLFWNLLEPEKDTWDFTGDNDIASFFRIAQEEGLNVFLRPGPYVCGEHDWGGFPAWLDQIDGMQVRANNGPFLDRSKAFISRVSQEVHSLQVTQGGPILMVQLENEYGSFGSDKEYLRALRDMLWEEFELFLYTNDGAGESYLDGGTIEGVLAETDGSPQAGVDAIEEYVSDSSMKGPFLCGEYYTTWFDYWNYTLDHSDPTDSKIISAANDTEWVLMNNHSLNYYMFHGGTNWRFDNGGIWPGAFLQAVTTSYDYGAPLDESGRPTKLYHALRDAILRHTAHDVPDIPETPPLAEIPEFTVSELAQRFFATLGLPATRAQFPKHMEAIGQSYGYLLYEQLVRHDIEGELKTGDQPRDRVIVLVNGKRVGVMDNTVEAPPAVTVSLKQGDTLQLLVENLGRVDYGSRMVDQRKGIVGNVTVNGEVLEQWGMFSAELSELPELSSGNEPGEDNEQPVFFKGSFATPAGDSALSRDTFLVVSGSKGVVWVNGKNIGRYWSRGPQQSLYLPGCFLRTDGANEIVILELEPEGATPPIVKGVSTREWFNGAR